MRKKTNLLQGSICLFYIFILTACNGIASPDISQGAQILQGTTTPGDVVPEVLVSDQAIQDGKVTITEVISNGPGWLVIHVQQNGTIGDAIGLTAVKNGNNHNVVVKVDPKQATPLMYAMLHIDSGMAGLYEYPGPDEPVMTNGQMVAPSFHILSATETATEVAQLITPTAPTINTSMPQMSSTSTANPTQTTTNTPEIAMAMPTTTQPAVDLSTPSMEVMDQTIQDGTITIPQVVSLGNWWLVIHMQNPDGSVGTMVGFTQVKTGMNTNVVVKVDMTLVTPVLYAMLHEDNGQIGVLTYPGPDVPVMVDGKMLVPSFNILSANNNNVIIRIYHDSASLQHLVDGQGFSLYISLADSPNKSNCNAACLETWHPLLANGKIVLDTGVTDQDIGVIVREDGSRQVTYLGAPLYTYAKDAQPGELSGQGVGGLWYAAIP